jgi:nitrogen fixation/metabolism regulation signal transduction histidine kinase
MNVFIIWLFIILALLTGYGVYLWRQSHQRSRLEARLTVWFLAFVLIPTVPLLFAVSELLIKTGEIILLPGTGRALNEALESLRQQIEEQAAPVEQALISGRPPARIDLAEFRIDYIGQACFTPRLQLRYFRSRTALTAAAFANAHTGPGGWTRHNGQAYYEHLTWQADSTVVFVGLPVTEAMCNSKDELIKALQSHSALSLLRDQFLQQGVVWTAAALLLLIMSLLAVMAARWTARGISEPIRLLSQGMQRVGSGDLSGRVTAKARDEIAFLIRSFNRMTQDLHISQEKLKNAERLAAWRDVARQISHEIKNPLTPMQLSLYRLRQTLPPAWADQSDVHDSFRMLEEEISSLRRLADEFSQFARLPEPDKRPENLCDIARQSITLFQAENPHIKISSHLQEHLPLLNLDRDQIRRALHNLLKNALEASRDNGTIEVFVQRLDAEPFKAIIRIVDYGMGMNEETLAQALQPHFTTKKHGSGLGLSIVQKIILDHGGTLRLDSTVQRGTTVTIQLP